MATSRGGLATTVKTVVGPQNIGLVGGGIGGTSNPGVSVVNPVTGIAPVAPPPPRGGPATPVTTPGTPGANMGNIDWASVLALDPGYTAAVASADAQIGNLNEAFDGATNPFSTVKQLALQLRQGLRSNGNEHAAHGTLFSGGTAQNASNLDRDNQKARYDAHNTLMGLINEQQGKKATALTDATGRIISNPGLYGLNTTGTDPTPAPGAPAPTTAPAPTASGFGVTGPGGSLNNYSLIYQSNPKKYSTVKGKF